jgi:hypothetical protein
MPRYFFHQKLPDGDRLIDEEGSLHPDLPSARAEAIASAREQMSERLRRGRPLNHSSFEIVDEAGALVDVVVFQDAIPGA